MALLKAIPIFAFILFSAALIQANPNAKNVNQDVSQKVNKYSGGVVNQNVEQLVDLDKQGAKKFDDLKSISQNVGQVVENEGGKTTNSNINQQVHQRVVDGDKSIDKITSQAVKDTEKSRDTSSEEIVFRRHHKGGKKSEDETTESSEEIKIHRGKHSSEIVHKKHEDKHGDVSEESEEEIKISKKPRAEKKVEEYSDEDKTKTIVYHPAKKIPIVTKKIVAEDTEKYIRPGSVKISQSTESTESIEKDETYVKSKDEVYKPKTCSKNPDDSSEGTCQIPKVDYDEKYVVHPKMKYLVQPKFIERPVEHEKVSEESYEKYTSYEVPKYHKYEEVEVPRYHKSEEVVQPNYYKSEEVPEYRQSEEEEPIYHKSEVVVPKYHKSEEVEYVSYEEPIYKIKEGSYEQPKYMERSSEESPKYAESSEETHKFYYNPNKYMPSEESHEKYSEEKGHFSEEESKQVYDDSEEYYKEYVAPKKYYYDH